MRSLWCFLVVLILSITSCDKRDEFGDALFVGTWNVNIQNKLILANNVDTTIHETLCVYDIRPDGTLHRICDTNELVLDWYYREHPKKIVLLDPNVVFFNVFEYEVVKCEENHQIWENRKVDGPIVHLTLLELNK